ETAKATARRAREGGPAQRFPQGIGIGSKHPFDFERRAVADVAVECEFQRRCGKPKLETGPLARQSGCKVVEAQRAIHRLPVPDEMSGRREAFRDRWPRQGE